MAKRRKKRRSTTRNDDYPGWVWMIFGLSIGLAVAFAVFINSRNTAQPVTVAAPSAPASLNTALESAPGESDADEPGEETPSRFEFYDLLPNFEVVIVEQEPDVRRDTMPEAIVDPGEYVLQAGSFSRFEDADRRRAQLALQGIESTIQRVSIDDRSYHRVRIGPTRDLDRLNSLRERLRQADIDVLRIRLRD